MSLNVKILYKGNWIRVVIRNDEEMKKFKERVNNGIIEDYEILPDEER